LRTFLDRGAQLGALGRVVRVSLDRLPGALARLSGVGHCNSLYRLERVEKSR
jgi:hypothetical protein